MKLYHGSKFKFKKFNFKKLGTNGTGQGAGIYLTPKKEIAELYADNGFLYSVTVNLQKELSLASKTLENKTLEKIIDELQKETDILNDINDVQFYGKNTVKKELTELLNYNDNDVDIYNELANICGNIEAVAAAYLNEGYTHIKATEQTRLKGDVIVVLSPEIIKIDEKTEVKK